MPFKYKHYLLRFGGHFGSSGTPVDTWSVGLRFGSPSGDVAEITDGVKDAWLAAAETAAGTFHSSSNVYAGSVVYISWVTVARIGLDGKYDPPSSVTRRKDRTPLPGSGTVDKPWNTANVISLRTARGRGYASNGRVYWPCPAIAVTAATGRVNTSLTTARLNDFKTFVNALNTAATTAAAGQLCVMSKVGLGDVAAVTSVRSDDRLDSIERRENKQPSIWTTVTL